MKSCPSGITEPYRAAHETGKLLNLRSLTPDETGWRVAGQPAWLHAWVTERATGYAIDPHRKADVLERLIGIDWSGKMVHDGFASYNRFKAATHQQCLVLLCQLSQALLQLRLTSIGLSECDLLLRLSENAIRNDEGLCRTLIGRKLYRLPEDPKLVTK